MTEGFGRDEMVGLGEVLADLEGKSERFGRALTAALGQAVGQGKGLDAVLRGLALRISGIALDAGLKPLQTLLSDGISGRLGGGKVTPFAKGGVIATPGYFPMGGGLGLAGPVARAGGFKDLPA